MPTQLINQLDIRPARQAATYTVFPTIYHPEGSVASDVVFAVCVDNTSKLAAAERTRRLGSMQAQLTEYTGLDVATRMRRVLEQANEKLYEQRMETGRNIDAALSATLVALTRQPNNDVLLQIAHVGRCRVHLLRNSQRSQLTVDHTWEAQGATLDLQQKDEPTRALGRTREIEIDTQIRAPSAAALRSADALRLTVGDRLLLCTYQLPDNVLDNHLDMLCNQPPQKAVKQIIKSTKATNQAEAVALLIDWPRKPPSRNWGRWVIALLVAALLVTGFLFRQELGNAGIQTGAWLWNGAQASGQSLAGSFCNMTKASYWPCVTATPVNPLPTPTSLVAQVPITTTVTATAKVTVAPTVTFTPMPANTLVPATATPSNTPTVTDTPMPTSTPMPISTLAPVPPTPTQTATRIPTKAPIPTQTQAPTLTEPAPITSTANISETAISIQRPELVVSDLSMVVGKTVEFQWRWNGKLEPRLGFEVRVWQGSGYHSGVQDAKKTTKDAQCINNVCRIIITVPVTEGSYKWAVAIVQLEPYAPRDQESLPGNLNISGQSKSKCHDTEISNCPNP